eukprot:1755679-Lingulodinium_polyedra.AAC.1
MGKPTPPPRPVAQRVEVVPQVALGHAQRGPRVGGEQAQLLQHGEPRPAKPPAVHQRVERAGG